MKVYAMTPHPNESAWIRYQLDLAGSSIKSIAFSVGVSPVSVSHVVSGYRHSARIESEIARVVGFKSWNDMLKAVRSGAA